MFGLMISGSPLKLLIRRIDGHANKITLDMGIQVPGSASIPSGTSHRYLENVNPSEFVQPRNVTPGTTTDEGVELRDERGSGRNGGRHPRSRKVSTYPELVMLFFAALTEILLRSALRDLNSQQSERQPLAGVEADG